MLRIMLLSAAFAACTPSPKDTAMHPPRSIRAATSASGSDRVESADSLRAGRAIDDIVPAGPGLSRAPVSAAAQGRRTLSTAFVRVGPDGDLTVELRDGRVLVLRDVVMRPKDYCGVPVLAAPNGTRYCGGYAEIVAARPGGAPPPTLPSLDTGGPGPRLAPTK